MKINIDLGGLVFEKINLKNVASDSRSTIHPAANIKPSRKLAFHINKCCFCVNNHKKRTYS
jgi:hypothetical protein